MNAKACKKLRQAVLLRTVGRPWVGYSSRRNYTGRAGSHAQGGTVELLRDCGRAVYQRAKKAAKAAPKSA